MRLALPALVAPLLLAACASSRFAGYGTPTTLTCVPYARAVSGIEITGDAWRWWDEADGRYPRAQRPVPGAVLVFRRHGAMTAGHVAVVTRVLGPREILVTQANWLPGRIQRATPVLDVSPANDWTSVRVWYAPDHEPGRTIYPTDGFILPAHARLETVPAPR